MADYAEATVRALHDHLDPGAQLIVEPGRSVVGRSRRHAVLGRHRQARRRAPTSRSNGGMGDNLEPMLYGQRFAPVVARRATARRETCELVGHHCESGDVLAPGVELATPQVGDLVVDAGHRRLLLLAVRTTTTARAGRRCPLPRRRRALAVRRERWTTCSRTRSVL